MMILKRYIPLLLSALCFFSGRVVAEQCGDGSRRVVKIYIPDTYTDQNGNSIQSFRSHNGSASSRGFLGYEETVGESGMIFKKLTVGGSRTRKRPKFEVDTFRDCSNGIESFTVNYSGTIYFDSNDILRGEIIEAFDNSDNEGSDSERIIDFDGYNGGFFANYTILQNHTYKIESNTRISSQYTGGYECVKSPFWYPAEAHLFIQLHDSVSLSKLIGESNPISGSSRISYIDNLLLSGLKSSESKTEIETITISGGNSEYIYTWTPPSCGEWTFTPIFKRWPIDGGASFQVDGEKLEIEPNDDGVYEIEGEVPAVEGFYTKFLYIEAKSDCESMPAGGSNTGQSSAYANFGLGDLNKQDGAGSLGFYEEAISQVIYTPAILKYGKRIGVEVVSHPVDQTIRQIVAPQTFVDILRPSSALATAYDAATTYALDDTVLYEDYVFVSLQASNTGNNPLTETAYWERRAPVWLDDVTYSVGDQVWSDNVLWEANVATTTLAQEPSASEWTVVYKPSEFEIRFYRPEDYDTTADAVTGIYPILAGKIPFVTYTVENPTPLAANPDQLKLTEERNSSVVDTSHWTQTGTDWSFSRGLGEVVTDLSKTGTFTDTTPVGTTRTERRKLKNSSGAVASDTLETYEMFPWGEELTSVALDPDGVNRVTLYHYHDEVVASPNYGRLKMQVGPFGNWTYYVYGSNGLRSKTISQFKNAAAPGKDDLPASVNESSNRVVECKWDTDADATWDTATGELKQTVTSLEGNEVSRSYRIEYATTETERVLEMDTQIKKTSYIECTVAGAAWDASTNLVTVERTIDEFSLEGSPFGTEYPDDTVTRYSYNYDNASAATLEWLITTREEGIYNYTPVQEFDPWSRDITLVDELGHLQYRESYRIDNSGNEILTDLETVTAWDSDTGKPTDFKYLDGTTRTLVYDCCGLESEYGRDGQYTHYTYDAAGRVTDILRSDILTSYVLDGAGRATQTTVSKGSSSIVTSVVYNKAGEVESSKDALGDITAYSQDTETISSEIYVRQRTSFPYEAGQASVWASTTLSYQDGSSYRNSGPGVAVARSYDYGSTVAGQQFSTETVLKGDLTASPEFRTTISDMLGRTWYVREPALDPATVGDAETEYSYNTKGQLEWIEDPIGIKTHYLYNDEGHQWKSYVGNDTNGPVNTNETFYTEASWDSSIKVRKTITLSGVDTADERIVEESLQSPLSGNEQKIVSTQYGVTTTTITQYADAVLADGQNPYVPADRTVTTTVVDSSQNQIAKTESVYEDGRLKSTKTYDTQDAILTETTNAYDDLGRLDTTTNANGTTTYVYYDDGRLQSMTTPAAVASPTDPGDEAQTTSYTYNEDPDGTLTQTITLPDGATQTDVYNPEGQLQRRSGARTYPVEYTYDYSGRMDTMQTWQDYPDGSSTTTKWIYNDRGLLKEKFYDYDSANPGTADLSYTYDDAGRLETRTGGRGIVTTYAYDTTYGYQTNISYDDGITSGITYSLYDRAGRPGKIEDASGARTLTYTDGRLDSETYADSGKPWDGVVIDRTFDDATRMSGVSVANGSGALHSVDYGYNAISGRLDTVSFANGGRTHTATYGYKAGTNLVESIVQENGSAEILAVQKDYDNLNRLRSLSYGEPHGDLGMSYTYNKANQRTYATLGNGEFWGYGYDSLGQVTRAAKHLSNRTVIPGYEFTYGFDDIGNRKSAGRDDNPARKQSYYAGANATGTNGANGLNQYGSRSVPRVLGVVGKANANASISVNGQTALRAADYYQALLDYSGATSPDDARYENIQLVGTYAGQGAGGVDAIAEVSTDAYLPPNAENFTHDADGNLTTDSKWTYTWNGDNRLIAMETIATAYNAGVPRVKLEFAYDSQGRRFSKKVYDWDAGTSAFVLSETVAFLYDGWNLLTELDGTGALIRSYTWGTDLSGTMQGAGGVGGLLAMSMESITTYPSYDGNGNVMALVDSVSGSVSAEYEYGPFGESIRSTGVLAEANPFTFSTKYQDSESRLIYYGYRYYDAELGRWLNRDPIEEAGGLNLYGMLSNDALNKSDYLGMARQWINCTSQQQQFIEGLESNLVRRLNTIVTDFRAVTANSIRNRVRSTWGANIRDSDLNRIVMAVMGFALEATEQLPNVVSEIEDRSTSYDCCADDEVGGEDITEAWYQPNRDLIGLVNPIFWETDDSTKEAIVGHEYGHVEFGRRHWSHMRNASLNPPRNISRLVRSADFLNRILQEGVNGFIQSLLFAYRVDLYQNGNPLDDDLSDDLPTPRPRPEDPPCTNLSCN
ncbi:RHS repeat-associated core domain-containing protein [Rubellicoccus peritrichatus]|uniref:RHS repeat-associated core domain-containing protein n=1 Tax=Rubellicoccus peritrichatus TaxID=3080537 RepID=A0AAQ3LGH6_9BACT|nr:RHS repeat-associated core domain-containing protein [Puniceicoccus sp. CR14]WOO43393.1 RHS repeat-associated core domain-containing protein [Puniceicoccus sp. CR14]